METEYYNLLEEYLKDQAKELYLIEDESNGRLKSIVSAIDAGVHVALNIKVY